MLQLKLMASVTVCCLLYVGTNSAQGLTITYIPDLGDTGMTFAQPSSATPNCCGSANSNLVTGRQGANTWPGRAAMRFDGLATLDNDATITSATLRLFRTSAPEANDGQQRLYLLTSSFTTAGLDPTCCTGNNVNRDLWLIADGIAGATVGTPFASFTAAAGYNSINVTSIVQNWQANNWANAFGFGLVGVESVNQSSVTFAGSLSATPMQLVLEYTLPIPAPEPCTQLMVLLGASIVASRRRAAVRCKK